MNRNKIEQENTELSDERVSFGTRIWQFIDNKINNSYKSVEEMDFDLKSSLRVEIKSSGVKLDINSLLDSEKVTRQVQELKLATSQDTGRA